MGALNSKHDGSILDNLGGLFGGGVNDEVKNDGDRILNHVLGGKKQGIEKIIVEKSVVDIDSVENILKIAAPILMAVLGKQTRENNISSSNDISGLFGGLLGGRNTQEEQRFVKKILDADGDGSVIDDVAGMVLGNANKKRGLGGLLGGLFGK